jgi:hypothetical protein
MSAHQLKEIHELLRVRIYHEDVRIAAHTYNFLTLNAFLAAVLGVALSINPAASHSKFNYLIVSFGLAATLIHYALARRAQRTIFFFREYLTLVEQRMGLMFDRALYEFYTHAHVHIPFVGLIDAPSGKGHRRKPLYSSFPWAIPGLRSSNTLLAVAIPALIGLFWTATAAILWRKSGGALAGGVAILGVYALCCLLAHFARPSKPLAVASDLPLVATFPAPVSSVHVVQTAPN